MSSTICDQPDDQIECHPKNLIVPNTYYPDWWNMHTHRCNHLSWLPLHQTNFGLGRAMVADWGRVGAVSVVCHERGVAKVVPQISGSLSRKLHYAITPSVSLPESYQSSLGVESLLAETTTHGLGENIDLDDDEADALCTFGYDDMLQDPVMWENASAAAACGKIKCIIRCNAVLTQEKGKKSVTALTSLSQLKTDALCGVESETADNQLKMINRMYNTLCGRPLDDKKENRKTEMYKEKPNPSSRGGQPSSRIDDLVSPPLRASMRKLIDPNLPYGDRRILATLDPFFVRLASRVVNPAYFGHGLLRVTRQTAFWSSPRPIFSAHAPPSLWFTPLDRVNPIMLRESSSPSTKLPQEPLCELDVHALSEPTSFAVLMRFNSQSESARSQSVAFATVNTQNPETCVLEHIVTPSLPDVAHSICFSPYLFGEWATAGHCVHSLGDDIAFVRQFYFDGKASSWSGHFALSNDLDGLSFATQTDTPDIVDTNMKRYIATAPSLRFGRTAAMRSSNQFPVRITYADHPSELCMITARRMLLIDTREPNRMQQLFHLSSDAFNPMEYFTHTPPKFIKDVFVLAGTPYSMVLLDKRMPERALLHWTHNLPAPPVYADLTNLPKSIMNKFDLPQSILATASQFPPDVGIVGLNVLFDTGPQLVGPSLAGLRQTNMTQCHNVGSKTSSTSTERLIDTPITRHRLQAALCGLANDPTVTEQTGIRVLSLTSHGDLFQHTWMFTSKDAEEMYESNRSKNTHWLSKVACKTTGEPEKSCSSENIANGDEAVILDLSRFDRLEPEDWDSAQVNTAKMDGWDYDNIGTIDQLMQDASSSGTDCLMHNLRFLWDNYDQTIDTDQSEELIAQLDALTRGRRNEEEKRKNEILFQESVIGSRLQRLACTIKALLPADDFQSNV